MKRAMYFWLVICGVLLVSWYATPAAAASTPKKGETLPAIQLAVPEDPLEKSYLGLDGQGRFTIPQIKADVVIIEIFSMYCPYCQREAPGVNDLYDLIQRRPDLKDRVKMIGIGAGSSAFEVGIFKKTYRVAFPLFGDGDFVIHKDLGEVRTPYFIGIKIGRDGSHEVIYSKLGGFDKADAFLALILDLAGLK